MEIDSILGFAQRTGVTADEAARSMADTLATLERPAELEAPTTLVGHRNRVAQLRLMAAELKDAKQAAEDAFRQQHADLLEAEADARKALAEAEGQLRDAALEEFRSTGDKEPTPGVKVQMRTVYQYDEADARSYAVQHAPDLFAFDARGFEKLAAAMDKAKRPLPFVTVDAEPRITLARSLPELEE